MMPSVLIVELSTVEGVHYYVGYTDNVARRMKQMLKTHPEARLVASVPGTRTTLEKALKRLDEHRIYVDSTPTPLFRPHPDVLAWVSEVELLTHQDHISVSRALAMMGRSSLPPEIQIRRSPGGHQRVLLSDVQAWVSNHDDGIVFP